MKSVEQTGVTVEAAIDVALERLGVSKDDVKIDILEEPNKGFLGLIGHKDARVRVIIREQKRDFAQRFMRRVLALLDLPVRFDVHEEEQYVHVDMEGEDLGLIIGRHGQTLNALQYLINIGAGKVSKEPKKIILDAGGYRARRRKILARLAREMADKVRRTGEPVSMEPMTAHERKAVHLALKGEAEVYTRSVGNEPFRKVVIAPGQNGSS